MFLLVTLKQARLSLINVCGSFNARRVRLILSFVHVLGFRVWVFVMFYYIWLVSFRKLKNSSGLMFLKRFSKLLVW